MSSSSSVPDYLRDENLTQKTKDLISSLPSEKGWLVCQMYQFQGRWHTQALLQGILTCQKHFEAKDSDIILVTNPKSVEAFCQGKFIGGPFWDHVLEYWYASLENPNKVLFVSYEELKKKTGETIKRIAEFLGCGFVGEEEVRAIVKLCSFESLSSLEVNREGKLPSGMETRAFFRKGEVGGWRDTLTESLAEVIDRTIEEKFQGSGLKFSC
uniref:Sulfotransferase n=1 Tax=Brassica campestris TaxID=3711 RepID=M4DLJ1_BRACM